MLGLAFKENFLLFEELNYKEECLDDTNGLATFSFEYFQCFKWNGVVVVRMFLA